MAMQAAQKQLLNDVSFTPLSDKKDIHTSYSEKFTERSNKRGPLNAPAAKKEQKRRSKTPSS